MFIEPHQLIVDTIDKLETVAAYFADEVEERGSDNKQLSIETLAAKEALQTIRILIPKLRTAQASQVNKAQMQFRECLTCE